MDDPAPTPVEFFVVRLPDGRARGAVDSTKGNLRAASSGSTRGIVEFPSPPKTGRRRRLSQKQRLRAQGIVERQHGFVPKEQGWPNRPRPKTTP